MSNSVTLLLSSSTGGPEGRSGSNPPRCRKSRCTLRPLAAQSGAWADANAETARYASGPKAMRTKPVASATRPCAAPPIAWGCKRSRGCARTRRTHAKSNLAAACPDAADRSNLDFHICHPIQPGRLRVVLGTDVGGHAGQLFSTRSQTPNPTSSCCWAIRSTPTRPTTFTNARRHTKTTGDPQLGGAATARPTFMIWDDHEIADDFWPSRAIATHPRDKRTSCSSTRATRRPCARSAAPPHRRWRSFVFRLGGTQRSVSADRIGWTQQDDVGQRPEAGCPRLARLLQYEAQGACVTYAGSAACRLDAVRREQTLCARPGAGAGQQARSRRRTVHAELDRSRPRNALNRARAKRAA